MIKLTSLLEDENKMRPVQRGMDKMFDPEDFPLQWANSTKTYYIDLDIVLVIPRSTDFSAKLHMRDDGTIQIISDTMLAFLPGRSSGVLLRGTGPGWNNQGKSLTAKLWPESALKATPALSATGTSLTNCIINIFQSPTLSSTQRLDISSIRYKVPAGMGYVENL
jgi:hypothetical protein